ncbi:amino acid adenylation domain-containing protein [Archangium gephyra]|uniref:non-ribosomal peptide synthetase n=1 Tax=Archangium gephyra TaxID=48 RepID=UPI0035D488D4
MIHATDVGTLEGPLTHGQRALWLFQQLAPSSAAYHIAVAARIRGQARPAALREALRTIMARHEVLRATFPAHEGRPVMRIHPSLEGFFQEVDASGWDDATLERYLSDEAHRPMDLERGPLLRMVLLTRSPGDHALLTVAHHMVADLWSMTLLVRELDELVRAQVNGEAAGFPAQPLSYREHARQQAERLAGPEGERLWDWWREALGGDVPALELPVDRPRPPVQTERGASHPVRLPPELWHQVEALASARGVTPFVVLLSAWQALLHRYSGQESFAVGSPTYGRRHRKLARLMGYLVNPIALRADLSGQPTGHELLRRVDACVRGALEHQDFPLPLLIERLSPERDASRSPLFQTMLVYQKAPLGLRNLSAFAAGVPGARLMLGDMELEALPLEKRSTPFELVLVLGEMEQGLSGALEYNADLFEAGTVARMAGHFTRLLEGLTAQPERPVHLLPLLSSEEHQALLVDFNCTGGPAPFVPVHQRFLALARQRPDAPALVYGQQTVGYGELASRSLALASVLRRHGVGPESLVGLFLEREPSCVVSLLAILHCGAAFLPLDTASPPQRLSLMVAQARLRLVVTTPELASRLPEGLRTVWAHEAGEALSPVDVSPESLAYAIFTSGSTGTPKAVLLSHSGLCNLAQAQVSGFGLSATSRTLQFASLSFDAAVSEIFTSLTSSACLVFAPREALLGDALVRTLREQHVTTVTLPPAVLSLLSPEGLEELRTVVSAGEACPPQVLARWASGRTLLNAYGPTESTVCATMSEAPVLASGHLSLGRPLPGLQVYVLDAHLQPVPVGVSGELFLSGAGLARGYLGLPSLTAERFLPHPFASEPGARLYRTGDAARFLPDGSLEYLGRLDSQVKLRGFRIELGEVESALLQHPSVHTCVALVREDSPGDKRLVAYLVPHPGQSVEAHSLRAFLQQRLPEYMVPAAFVSLSALPLSSNGKVDKKALPLPESPASQDTYVAPRTPTEERLASLWAQVLRVERVGLHDDFFALGGHSLLATQLISRIRSAFGVELPVRAFFEAPTVRSLAERIDAASDSQQSPQRPAIEPVPRAGTLPLSFAQQRLWFLNELEPASPFYNVPAAARVRGALDMAALRRAFEEVLRRHEALRTTFVETDGRPVQVISPEPELDLRVVDLSALPSSERETRLHAYATREARAPFALDRGPLVRLVLLRLEREEHMLLLTMHHIVSDGWSIGVLIRELASLYDSFLSGLPSSFPELAVQYADFASWQRQWLSGPTLDAQLSWWTEHLRGIPPALELPTDRPRPPAQSFRGAHLPFSLPSSLLSSLEELSRREGATLFMTLLAAFQSLLHRYSGSPDVVVGTPIANRHLSETEPLIGFFVNSLPLRARFASQPSFLSLLSQVRDASLGAFAHQDLPFERLVEELSPQRSLGRTPLFQVMFALQNAPLPPLQLSSLSLEPMEVETGVAKFDLYLSLQPSADGLAGSLEYSTDLFDAGTARRMLGHFSRLLSSAVAHPDWPVSRLPLLPEDELRQLLVSFSGPPAPRSSSFLGLVREQAALHPDALAVVSEHESLTYAQLAQRAHQLSGHLRSLGVSHGSLVALCLERSPLLAVSLLAVLESGAAYVPLDPAYPQQRLDFMLQDSGASLVLSQRHLAASLPSSARAVFVDEPGAFSGTSAAPPPVEPHPDSLAYVIYTSGSTGTPKGVAMRHGALANLIHWQLARSPLPSATTLQFAPLSFDVSFQEFFSSWAAGACLVLAPPALRREPAALLRFLTAHRVQRLFLPFVALQQLAQAAHEVEPLPPLVEVITAGEQLQVTPSLVSFFSRLPGCVLDNQYGPSETHVVSAFRLSGDSSLWPALPPIGQPLPGTQLLVLDAHFQPCPLGVPGELYLAGENLSRGYLGRPALTAERFLPHPFASEPGARLYRTGDAARLLPDGHVEFLGRLDSQVKLRGFRIELGEVEAALQQHPSVHQAAASIREDSPGDRRLVLYVVPAQGQTPDASALRAFLLQRMPDYMVPAAFVALPAFPLTPSGKVDKKALPAPDSGALARTPSRPPQSQTEVSLASLWAPLLGLSTVGAQDDFFALGGHSLLATQLASRIRASFGVELPLRALFEAPTLEALAARIDALASSSRPARLPPLVAVPRSGPLPLSFSQQRLWFLNQLEPDSPFYNVPAAVRIRGNLHLEALQRAFDEVLRRHEVLRTVFSSADGQPFQSIVPPAPLSLQVVELGALPAHAREEAILQHARAEASRPFSLAQAPLLRVSLLRLEREEHVLLLTMHHIVSDGWSIGVLIRELASLYDSFLSGLPSSLPELAVQYADFASWQRQWLSGPTLDAQLSWWTEHLRGIPPALELPTDRPRPPAQSFRGAHLPFSLPSSLLSSLEELSRRQGATLFMTLLAAFQSLLHRYSGSPDVVVGTPIANRHLSETEPLIGFFVNSLPLRARFSSQPSFLSLLSQVRDASLGAFAHQDLPFERLVEELSPQRSLGRTPLFQVMFALQNAPLPPLQLSSLSLEPLPLASRTTRFDLTLSLEPSAHGLSGSFEYSTDLFDEPTIARLGAAYRTLLKAVVAHPELPVSRLPLLAPTERAQRLESCRARAHYPAPLVLHRLFEAQARRTPDNLALAYEGTRLTYRQLEAQANRVAHRLRALGVGPETRVGLFMERSAELVVGLLGILKAGGTYVPLDPAYPRDRLTFMLEDSGVPAVVTQAHLVDTLPAHEAAVLVVDTGTEPHGPEAEPPAVECLPEHAAYVIYTSGSTGRPKGVVVTHANVTRLMDAAQPFYGFDAGDVWTLFHSYAFDFSVWELWGALLYGGRLVVVPYFVSRSPEDFWRLLRDERVTVLNQTPSAFRQLMAADEALAGQGSLALRYVIFGGEALELDSLAPWFERHGDARPRLVNMYGITETTVHVTLRPIGRADVAGGSVIGGPLADLELYVLDAHLEPQPPGVAGELFVGGAGLARGYLHRPELCAERFIPHPFATEPGARLYRTGDLARFLPDGDLEYLGRIDQQVKIRGFRIELGEIEAVVRTHPSVREAAVVVREDVPGDKRLVAYVVPREPGAARPEPLRDATRERLPEYMVPSAFVFLEALPLTSNGKLDRKALPAPERTTAESGPAQAPRTPVETRLATLWAEVLHVETVGTGDDFFALGGHSLLAAQLQARIREAFSVELPLRAFFEVPTLEQMAARLEELGAQQAPPLPLEPAPRSGPLPLSFAQERLWFMEQLEPGTSAFHIPVALRLEGALDTAALERCFQEVVRRHEVLRTTFARVEGQPVQVISEQGTFTLEQEDLRALPAAERERETWRLTQEEAARPFDLTRGPLLRARLLRLEEHASLLLLTMHHIASDGWSMGVLVREVAALYEAFVSGQPPALPALPVQYADLAWWQRGWLHGEALQSQLSWWREQLTGAPAALRLPTDKPRASASQHVQAVERLHLPPERAEALRQLARAEGATLYMLLLAAFQTLLYRFTGDEDVVVGSPVANRGRREVEGLIGLVLNTLALRTRLSGDPSFRELLQRVRGTVLGALAHQELPFDRLVEELQPPREPGRTPLFQVWFVLQNTPMPALRLPGLNLSPVEAGPTRAQFDLTLVMSEEGTGLVAGLGYDTDLFSPATVRGMLDGFDALLRAVVEAPERRLLDLPLTTAPAAPPASPSGGDDDDAQFSF